MFPNWIDRRSRQKRETKQQTNKEKPRKKMRIIVPTMNHCPRNGLEGDPEFSTRRVSNPSLQDLFTCDISTKWIVYCL